MKPVTFDGANVTFAEDQPQYQPLPALRCADAEVTVISCWRLGFWERIRVLLFGRVWLSLCTFGKPLQPIRLGVACPFLMEARERDDQVI